MAGCMVAGEGVAVLDINMTILNVESETESQSESDLGHFASGGSVDTRANPDTLVLTPGHPGA